MPTSSPRPLIALDADGVLLDFHHGYADAWHRAFGARPLPRDPQAYWPADRWEVEHLEGERLRHFGRHFDLQFWSNLPALPGAVEACHRLRDEGQFDLVCVSALESAYEQARLGNLRALGFPIERVIATGHHTGARSPKADAVTTLNPIAFVDDFLPYFRGVPGHVHTALILREPNGSPNRGEEMSLARSTHQNLAAFAQAWLS